jgi:hypothetical protein
MKTLAVPLIALGVAAGSFADEPAQRQMRAAFESKLAADVQTALAFVAETGGPAAIERVRQAGTDRFTVRSFRKTDCTRSDTGHVCGFVVDIDVVDGLLHRELNGSFIPTANGLVFKHEA